MSSAGEVVSSMEAARNLFAVPLDRTDLPFREVLAFTGAFAAFAFGRDFVFFANGFAFAFALARLTEDRADSSNS